ncbi:MAG: IS200/IS605 family transposase [Candidatus Cloacimonadales bacterium]
MGQSLVKNYLHIIFSTKNRSAYLNQENEKEIYSYIAKLCQTKGCPTLAVGGNNDHVHVLCLLSKTLSLSDLIMFIKSNSSKWLNGKFGIENFSWQNGYGAFSVNPREIQLVVDYISKQKEHHHQRSFQEELLYFLHKYDIEYDKRYIWE